MIDLTDRRFGFLCSRGFEELDLIGSWEVATMWQLPGLRAPPGVTVAEARWTRAGPVWTSGGVPAGMDPLLNFIAAEAGEDAASQVQWTAEYGPGGHIHGDAHRSEQVPAYLRRVA